MSTLTKDQIAYKFERVGYETPLSSYQELVVKPNETFMLKSKNSHFPSVTLNSGSIFEIANDDNVVIPIRLEIGKLILRPNGPAALIRFFNLNRVDLNGAHGRHGARGIDGTRSGGGVQATAGQPGEDGQNGRGLIFRGVLHLAINEIEIIPNTPLTRSILSIDGLGPAGGHGGNGGHGGAGGNGMPSQNGAHDCDWYSCRCTRGKYPGGPGGHGGNGGNAGRGHRGGDGANIFFQGPLDIFNVLEEITDLEGGDFGIVGRPGDGGPGGHGATAATGGGSHCGRSHPAQPNGNQGNSGGLQPGDGVVPGARGRFIRVDSLPSYKMLISELVADYVTDKLVL